MNVEAIKNHLESRRIFNEKSDKELKILLGIPDEGITVGLSCDPSFVGDKFPTTDVAPELGMYSLKMTTLPTIIEVADVHPETNEVTVNWISKGVETPLRLSTVVLDALFSKWGGKY